MLGKKICRVMGFIAVLGTVSSVLLTEMVMAQEAMKPPKFIDPEKAVPPKVRSQPRVPGEQSKEAQEAARAAQSARKPGELESWSDTPKSGRKGQGSGKNAAQDGAGTRRAPGDGGLPLPGERSDDANAPVGFDKNGNLGTGFKF